MHVLPFIATLTAVRLVRFGLDALLAARFGTLVIRWLNSDVVTYLVVGFAVLALTGTAVTIYTLWRRTRGAGSGGARLRARPSDV